MNDKQGIRNILVMGREDQFKRYRRAAPSHLSSSIFRHVKGRWDVLGWDPTTTRYVVLDMDTGSQRWASFLKELKRQGIEELDEAPNLSRGLTDYVRNDNLLVYVDVDGTLTHEGHIKNGTPNQDMIQAVKDLIAAGAQVVVWSGNGMAYAREFCETHGIETLALGKPAYCVDDNPDIRPRDRMPIMHPEWFLRLAKKTFRALR